MTFFLLPFLGLGLLGTPATAWAAGLDTALASELGARSAWGLAAELWRLRRLDAGPDAEEARLAQGEAQLLAGRPIEAARSFQAWTLRHSGAPGEDRAWLGLARARARSGDYQEAVEAARAVRDRSGAEGRAAALVEADALYESGRFQEAEAAYAALNPTLLNERERAYLPYARAWCLYRWALLPRRDGGEDSKALLRRAAELFDQAAAGSGPYAAPARYQQAECAYAEGDWETAARAYESLEKQHPRHERVPAARYSLAWCRFQQGRFKDAAVAFHRFSVVHATHALAPWALYMAGVSYARGGDLDLAESAYRAGLQSYPEGEVVDRMQYGLAWLATKRGDNAAAVSEWQGFLKRWPDSPLAASATFLLADALYKEKRYATAREQYLTLLKRFPADPLAEDALYYAANASLALGENAQARDEFQQFLRLRPSSSLAQDAQRRLADCYYALGQYDAAEKGYEDIRSRFPRTQAAADSALGLGWVAFSRGDWGRAAERFKLAAGELKGDARAEAWLRCGDALFNLADYEGALLAYRQAEAPETSRELRVAAHMGAGWAAYRRRDFVQAYGEWGHALVQASDETARAEAAYWMAWCLFRQGRWDEAAQAYAEVTDRWPNSHLVPDALVQQANSLQNAGRCEDALPIYQRVSDAWPRHPKAVAALHGLQICYAALGRDEEAVAVAKAFVKQHADSAAAPLVQYQVAEHYLARKDYARAEKELDELKAAYPKSAVDIAATYWRGQARFKNLKFSQAIQDWKDVVARAPQHPLAPRALFKTGLAWYRLQEYGQAESTFRQVVDAYGDTPDVAADARFNLGLTYKRMGRDEDAIRAYREVVEKHPGSELASMAAIRIGYIYEDAQDYAQAIGAYRAVAAMDKGKIGAEAQYLVGDCLLAQKKFGEALLAYRSVQEFFPEQKGWIVTALAKRGELLESLGKDREALEEYAKIVDIGGDPAWVHSAKKRMELIQSRLSPPQPPFEEGNAVKTPAKPKLAAPSDSPSKTKQPKGGKP